MEGNLLVKHSLYLRRHKMRKRQSFAWVCSIGIILVMAGVFLASPPQAWAQSATKSIELSFATHIPAKASPYHSAFLPWAKEIEKRSHGMIKIKFYLSRTLLKPRDAYDGVVNGIADMAWAAHSVTPKRFPLISVFTRNFRK
jgi:TRAP-type C4-dicarboxylate transport system substrate-binding protein